jgi:2-polyprenyl-3-methyl-5-hydroxy-6-metoxy-1,4-benzoquinol methylase
MKEKWNERYASPDFIYGTEPNEFFRQQLHTLAPGRLLLPGEGAGRNAVYAAKQGWTVDAFDFSEQAMKKALYLAANSEVEINYTTATYEEFNYPRSTYDAIGLIFTHMPSIERRVIHRKLVRALKPNGLIILEAFHKEQLRYTSGGPKETDLLYDLDEIASDFEKLEKLILEKTTVVLNEGKLHTGDASVIRFVGKAV